MSMMVTPSVGPEASVQSSVVLAFAVKVVLTLGLSTIAQIHEPIRFGVMLNVPSLLCPPVALMAIAAGV
jgi:hypothetical protein